MDAMVTARISQEKKARGNAVLAAHGTTPSRIIGELYEYLIERKELPDLSVVHGADMTDMQRAEAYREFMETTVLPVSREYWNGALADDDALFAALGEKYGLTD